MNVMLPAPALLTLPRLDQDTSIIVSALLVLLAVALAARAILAVLSLRSKAQAAEAMATRLDEQQPRIAARVAEIRTALADVNGALERRLWALPELDRRMTLASQLLEQRRARLDAWRADEAAGLRRLIDRIRGTLGAIRTALRMRRAIIR